MMNLTKGGRLGFLSATCALVVVAGCQTAPTVTPGTEGTVAGKTNTGTTGTPAANNKPAQPAQPDIGEKTVVDTDTIAPTVDTEGLAPVDSAKAMYIDAAAGGTYVSDDGLLTAVIPPGALSESTNVRFVRLDTSKEKNTNQRLAGIRFQLDIGNAYIKPDQKIQVSAKADDRLITDLKAMYADYSADKWALSQDAKGNWNVTMPVKGPSTVSLNTATAPADPYLTDRRGVMTEGFAPLPAGKGGNFKRDSRIEAFCNYYPPPPPKPQHKMKAHCTWLSDDPALNEKPAYDANSKYNTFVRFGNATTTTVTGVDGRWTKELVPGSPAVPERSHWEKAVGKTATGIKTESGAVVTYAELGITAAQVDQIDETLWPANKFSLALAASNDAAADGGGGSGDNTPAPAPTLSPAQMQALVKSDRAQVDASGVLMIKIIDQAAKAAVPDTFKDTYIAGWINTTPGDNNEDVRAGYEPVAEWGGCFCAWTVHRDKIVADLSPQAVDSNGDAYNWVRETFTISAQGYTLEPNPTPDKYVGAGIGGLMTRTITAAGPNSVDLLVPRYSPMLGVDLSSETKTMDGELKVLVEIDGTPREYTFGGNGTKSQTINFRVRLADNEPHKLAIKGVAFADNTLVADQNSLDKLQNLSVRRNGMYEGNKINIIPVGAK